ncbi:MAG: DUF3410 domain-containing protein [Kiritimatiellae bacterium]|nr:DUF3410 domain-containing protein [Kiritimatiellia bacterium]
MKILYDKNMVLGDELFARLGEATAIEGRALKPEALTDVDLLFIRSTCRVNEALLSDTSLRFIGSGVVGTDHIDFNATRARNIQVVAAPGCNAESVANYVIAALLVIGERQKRSWQGATLGIVGVGHVGRLVWKFAEQALGMKVIGCDPPRQEQGDFAARDFISSESLIEQADVITFHVPLTPDGPHKTVGMFSGPIVRKVKPGAVLLNFARGPVCDNALVATMLGAGFLSDAAIDCWEGEPDYSPDLAAVAALTTPHIAGHAYEGKANGTIAVYQAACKFLGVEPGELPTFPPAPVPELEIDCAGKTDEAVMRIAVQATCDIEGDTARFRASFDSDVAKRKANFDALRKHYPFRRLFSATTLILRNASPELEQKLSAIGFQIQKATAKKTPAKRKSATPKASAKAKKMVGQSKAKVVTASEKAKPKTSSKRGRRKDSQQFQIPIETLGFFLTQMREKAEAGDYDIEKFDETSKKLMEFAKLNGLVQTDEALKPKKTKPTAKKATAKKRRVPSKTQPDESDS